MSVVAPTKVRPNRSATKAAHQQAHPEPTPGESAPTGPVRRDSFAYPSLSLTAECRGSVAVLVSVEPRNGWRLVDQEDGPDEDVDATLHRGGERFEIEVYCNRGHPRPVTDIDAG